VENTGVFVLIGLAAGIVSGFFGVGGGAIIVPALVYFAGFDQHRATGTSLAVLLLPVGLGAVFAYYRNGNVDVRAAAVMALSLFAAAWASGFLANRVSGAALKLSFGVFMTLMGLYIVVSSYGKLGK
jgi:uncharacterized membrane protein YfcA